MLEGPIELQVSCFLFLKNFRFYTYVEDAGVKAIEGHTRRRYHGDVP